MPGNLFVFLLLVFAFTACDDEDDTPTPQPTEMATFTVTIENVMEPKTYLASGTTAFLMPGESQEISFHAGRGHYLSLATMFVQSNDLFYAFDEMGLRLYDDGNAATGDVTRFIDLWDAGTEVNEMPGSGPNQAPRQSGPDTGDEENGTVELIDDVNDGFSYPADEAVIRLTLAHDGGTEFTLTIENVSGNASLSTPLAPGVWAVHGEGGQLFTSGEASSEGLQDIAEDGDISITYEALADDTGYVSPLAPGAWAIHKADIMPLFEENTSDRGEGLEELAEDGDPSVLMGTLADNSEVSESGVFNTPVGASGPGPLLPGNSYTFTFEAEEGDYLSFATMLVHTNDLFYGPDENGLDLFENGTAIEGDLTGSIQLWDAGTEVNEYPGAGNNQPARGGGNSGAAENGTVREVDDAFTYPAVADAIRVTISTEN